MMKKGIAILGSTGSIGTQTLEVIDANSTLFDVQLLSAKNNSDLIIKQALKYVPSHVVIGDASKYAEIKEALKYLPTEVHVGHEALAHAVTRPEIEMVVTAMVGYAGLLPTINAIKAGKHIALANKETLVVAGDLIMELAKQYGVNIFPVDSEHSAIFQCLVGEEKNPIEKILLTASGGPFRNKTVEYLNTVSPAEALKHPNWCMGAKITIDSSTLMNKGLEAIEAKWLFNVDPQQIEVVVHPESIIHSMVQFTDGSIKAQMGLPDMKLPIQYALGYPVRLVSDFPRLSFTKCKKLTFDEPDLEKFPCLKLAYHAMELQGNMPCIMNAANEIVVEAFLTNRIGFMDIPKIIEKTMEKATFEKKTNYDTYCNSDAEARAIAKSFIK